MAGLVRPSAAALKAVLARYDIGVAMSTAISPLAPQHVPEMPAIAGVTMSTAAAGIRYAGRTDVLLALFDHGTTAAGVFTRSKCPSAPVEWCRAQLKHGKATARALVVNSGNANAFTGKTGARPPSSPPTSPLKRGAHASPARYSLPRPA